MNIASNKKAGTEKKTRGALPSYHTITTRNFEQTFKCELQKGKTNSKNEPECVLHA